MNETWMAIFSSATPSCATTGKAGVVILPTAGIITASINRLHSLGNGNSGLVALKSDVTVSDSEISGNAVHGLYAEGATGRMTAEGVRVTGNGVTGVITISGATIRLSNTAVVDNTVGFNNGGTINTFSNNKFAGNTSPNVGVLTAIAVQ